MVVVVVVRVLIVSCMCVAFIVCFVEFYLGVSNHAAKVNKKVTLIAFSPKL